MRDGNREQDNCNNAPQLSLLQLPHVLVYNNKHEVNVVKLMCSVDQTCSYKNTNSIYHGNNNITEPVGAM